MKVLTIIPAYNEANNLPRLVERVSQYRERYDVVVIDDASTDQTAQVARAGGIPVVRLAANMGIGGAVQTGFKYALQYGYDVVIQLDGDGQHDPAWIEALLAPIAAGEADCVIGSRYMKENPDREYKTPVLRRIGMLFSSMMLSLVTGQTITDTTSGFRALNRRAYEYFAREYPVDHPDAEALLLLHLANYKIKEVPVKMHSRRTGRSSINWIQSSLYPFRVVVGFIEALLKDTRLKR